MSIIMVPDPTYAGRGTPPLTIRSWAMRALFEGGMEVGEIARKYEVTYSQAYRAINPPRQLKPRVKPERSLKDEKPSKLFKLLDTHRKDLKLTEQILAELLRRDIHQYPDGSSID